VRAWTEDGPFYWDGKHYTFPYVNPWPRPYQRPHPPIWLPGQGSAETIAEAARRRYPFMMVFAPLALTKLNYDMYREAAAEAGYTPTPDQLAFCVPVHTAETDAKAHAEAREHFEWLFHTALKLPAWQVLPPGYMSSRSLRGMLAGRAQFGMKDYADISYQEMLDQQYIIVGSPDTVADRLSVYSEELGAGIHIGGGMAGGSMPHELVQQSMHLFAEVMPRFRNEPVATAAQPAHPGGDGSTHERWSS
jgi:alkanesulfonate monooxygenase SsuD/methylene tetrahydromethanopterin reductase-like flavin-dependent oxidoreductase (luciferase family)